MGVSEDKRPYSPPHTAAGNLPQRDAARVSFGAFQLHPTSGPLCQKVKRSQKLPPNPAVGRLSDLFPSRWYQLCPHPHTQY